MVNQTDSQDIISTFNEIKNILRDIDMKLDHLIRTYHDEFFETGDPDHDNGLQDLI